MDRCATTAGFDARSAARESAAENAPACAADAEGKAAAAEGKAAGAEGARGSRSGAGGARSGSGVESGPASRNEAGTAARGSGFSAQLKSLLPLVCGLACAHAGALVATSGSLRFTDEGVFTNGSALVSLVPCLIVAAVLFNTRFVCTRSHMRAILSGSIAIEAAAVLVMGVLRASGNCTFPVRFALSVVATISAAVCVACWLRRRFDDEGSLDMTSAAVLVFSAMFAAQVPVFVTIWLPDGLRCLFIFPFVLAQYLAMAWARRRGFTQSVFQTRSDDYFSFLRSGAASTRFLIACAMGMAALALVVGFLEGYPKGDPIPFTLCARTVCFVLTELMCSAFIALVMRNRLRTMTVQVWIAMELLAAITLVLYCAFPGHLEVGAVTVTMLNTLMTAFVWHLVISFVANGWRDPFYYAAIVWTIWVAARSIGRFVLLAIMPTGGDSHFTGTVISLLLLVSTQLILVKLIDVSQFAAARALDAEGAQGSGAAGAAGALAAGAAGTGSAAGPTVGAAGGAAGAAGVAGAAGTAAASGDGLAGAAGEPASSVYAGSHHAGPEASALRAGDIAEAAERDGRSQPIPNEAPTALSRLLGLDADSTLADTRHAVARHNAELMGEQFMLSEREIEVLALYVSGFTQQRVADELHISKTTAHTHIGRIYAKTGLHSRQELLDYMRTYGDM